MRLKSFYAQTMTEAMKMVRDTLGDDAVIVATREERGDTDGVRVTAAVEQHDPYDDNPASSPVSTSIDDRRAPHFELDTFSESDSDDSWNQYDDEDESTAVIETLTDVMLKHSVPDEITDQIISCATVIGLNDPYDSLVAAIEHLYSFRPMPQTKNSTATMLVGPPGAGKTLATAKLTARAVMSGLRVSVITTDTIRAGGYEQLSAFTKLMNINLIKASNTKQLQRALMDTRGADQVYIDTGGMNPYNQDDMKQLARLISAGDIEPVLVMPGGGDADESGEVARIYATLGVRSLIPTRLDMTKRLGGILGAAHHGGLIFADASNTAKVADGLFKLSPKRLSHLLFPQSAKRQKQSAVTQTKSKVTVG